MSQNRNTRFALNKRLKAAVIAALVGSTALPVVPLFAQDKSTTTLEEIVVTARKREENLQTAPVSVSAFTAEDLREQGVADLKGIANATPNMQFTYGGNGSGGGNFAQVFLRGVGQPDFIITKDPGVGVYVDGVYLARAPGSVLELLDVERIEVLRGPQGTLFGKNTIGGAINVITKKPTGDTSGVVEATIGSDKRRDISGSVEFPMVDGVLAARVSALSRTQDGFYERLAYSEGNPNQFGADVSQEYGNDTNRNSARATLLFTPTDTFSMQLSGDVTKERQQAVEYQAVALTTPPNIALYQRIFGTGLYSYAAYTNPDPWTTSATWPGYNNSDIWGSSLTVDWDLGPVAIKSITGYRDLFVQTKGDADATPYQIVSSGGVDIWQDQFSEELQISGTAFAERMNWIGGLWYFEESAKDIQRSRQLVGLYDYLATQPFRSVPPGGAAATFCTVVPAPATCLGGGLANTLDRNVARLSRTGTRLIENQSYAAFIHATYAFTPKWSMSVGARQSHEEKEFTYSEFFPLLPLGFVDPVNTDANPANDNPALNNPGFPGQTLNDSWDVFTPKVSVEFKPTDDMMVYLQGSTGFKAGGYNGRPSSQTGLAPFDPENIRTVEAGLKSEWLDHSLRVNTSVFWSEYTDIQITRISQVFAGVRVEENAGDGRIYGFEIEVAAKPVDGLTLTAAAGYTNFQYTTLLPGVVPAAPSATGSINLDSTLPFVPEFTGNLAAAYEFALGSLGSLTVRGDYKYSDSYFIDSDNSFATEQAAYDTFDARMAWMLPNGKTELSVGGTNLTNEAVIANGVTSNPNGSQIVTYKPPRQAYFSVRVNF